MCTAMRAGIKSAPTSPVFYDYPSCGRINDARNSSMSQDSAIVRIFLLLSINNSCDPYSIEIVKQTLLDHFTFRLSFDPPLSARSGCLRVLPRLRTITLVNISIPPTQNRQVTLSLRKTSPKTDAKITSLVKNKPPSQLLQ